MSAYDAAGVDYATLDAAKRAALFAAASTSLLPAGRGAHLDDRSRGESAVLFELGGRVLAHVLECLGTKSMIARAYEAETGVDRFDAVGYDTVAAVANDLACSGALPLVVNAYFATGSSSWYEGTRPASLIEGFRAGCEDAGAAWGGGESPSLAGLVAASEIDLAASAVGVVPDGCSPWLGEELAPGDEIVLVASTGLHANGASLARSVADRLPERLSTRLASGRPFGEALLDRSAMYVRLLEACQTGGIPLRYASHITGHGLRKVMRAARELTYRIEHLPPVPEVLSFLVAEAGLGVAEAYGTFNMGAGLALFAAAGHGEAVVASATKVGLSACLAGLVEVGSRKVVLEPVGVEYGASELELR